MSAHSFDPARAYLLARCSEAAYAEMDQTDSRTQFEESLRMKIRPCESLRFNDHLGIAAFIGTTDDDVVLSFRGTVLEVHDLKHAAIAAANWIINLTFSHAKYGNGRAMIHEGFGSAVETTWADLRQEILRETQQQDKRLWITGHSLGGALAALVADRLSDDCHDSVDLGGVYTFGAPRIGNQAFADEYTAPLFRIENANDPIPHLPPPPSLMLPVQEALRQPFEILGQLLSDSVSLVRNFGGELGDMLQTFIDNLLKWLQNVLGVEYIHAGRLKFFDWDGDLIHLDELFSPKEIGEEIEGTFFGELLDLFDAKADFEHEAASFMNDLSRPFADVGRFVRLLSQFVADLTNGRLSIFDDHGRARYVERAFAHSS